MWAVRSLKSVITRRCIACSFPATWVRITEEQVTTHKLTAIAGAAAEKVAVNCTSKVYSTSEKAIISKWACLCKNLVFFHFRSRQKSQACSTAIIKDSGPFQTVWTTCISSLDWDTPILAQPISYLGKNIKSFSNKMSRGREEVGSIPHTTHFAVFLSSLIYIHIHSRNP